jgi:hypothetical protein
MPDQWPASLQMLFLPVMHIHCSEGMRYPGLALIILTIIVVIVITVAGLLLLL